MRLRLGDAADAARRTVDARVDADLAEAACAEQRIQFTTQARTRIALGRRHPALTEELLTCCGGEGCATHDAMRVVLLQGGATLAMNEKKNQADTLRCKVEGK